jgi:hypothetical protein
MSTSNCPHSDWWNDALQDPKRTILIETQQKLRGERQRILSILLCVDIVERYGRAKNSIHYVNALLKNTDQKSFIVTDVTVPRRPPHRRQTGTTTTASKKKGGRKKGSPQKRQKTTSPATHTDTIEDSPSTEIKPEKKQETEEEEEEENEDEDGHDNNNNKKNDNNNKNIAKNNPCTSLFSSVNAQELEKYRQLLNIRTLKDTSSIETTYQHSHTGNAYESSTAKRSASKATTDEKYRARKGDSVKAAFVILHRTMQPRWMHFFLYETIHKRDDYADAFTQLFYYHLQQVNKVGGPQSRRRQGKKQGSQPVLANETKTKKNTKKRHRNKDNVGTKTMTEPTLHATTLSTSTSPTKAIKKQKTDTKT